MKRLRKGDTVQIMVGKDKGKTGEILRVIPDKKKVIVQKLNLIKRHTKPTQQSQGGIIERPAPMNWDKVMVVCSETSKPTRVKYEVLENKSKIRKSVRSNKIIN
ncbi:MAG: 50S ribosomal protein L24 [Candidatus Margulisbacteria bacterium]|nr:50S ribosomal protein L24 [Candidatus Margulisiibacteriota bacterium]